MYSIWEFSRIEDRAVSKIFFTFGFTVAEHPINWTSEFSNFSKSTVSSRISGSISLSISSKTIVFTDWVFIFFKKINSFMRTGLPIITFGFSFKVSICRFKGVPPIHNIVLNLEIFWISLLIWDDNSWVGDKIIAWTDLSSSFMFCKIGNKKARVFPVPVSDWKSIDLFCKISGITFDWTAVGVTKLFSCNFEFNSSVIPKSKKVVKFAI